MGKVCSETFRNNRICEKLAYFLRNLQTSRENNSRILRIKDAIFSGNCFFMNKNIWGDFQICISVPLKMFWEQGVQEISKKERKKISKSR